jgi:hypothetical protein
VFILANAVDPTENNYTKFRKSERVRIGWLGGSSHLKILEILNGVVGRLRNDNLLDKVQFMWF